MTLIKWNRPNMANIFEDFFENDFMPFYRKGSDYPATNIIEKDDAFELEFAVPGMKKEDIDINFENNILTVSSEKEMENKDANYNKREFVYSKFTRSFTVPETVNNDKISASYKDGILFVTLPKREDARTDIKKQIKIS